MAFNIILNSKLKIFLFVIGIIILLLAMAFIIFRFYLNNYKDPWHEKLAQAGVTEKNVQIGQVNFNYAEGPDNGPALLLLNAQHMDWYSYSRVMPELSTKFHVFAVDYPGHGKTTYPEKYPMNANQIGGDLATLIETVIQEPAYVTGNSSGGLLTTWLAANKPELVKAIVLEDPPLFNSEYPKVKETVAYRSFSTAHNYVEEIENDDFLLYWLESNSAFFEKHAGKFSVPLIKSAVNSYRSSNPGEAVEISFLPDTVRLMIRGFNYYDPHFGNAFYDGSWNGDFDHAQALGKITCPALLIHANFEILDSGELYGGLDQDEADRVVSLIPNCEYIRVDSDHVTHLDNPDQFIQIIEDFFLSE
ncbi:alpha/beta fold hydrolase [Desulfosporosinus shakirovi]|uniref:alpha/beta fold hydrolase n=1 Tax=Desulfosporosinus shakirovi TaxID=2885154 RepID=UPI001E3AEA7A|nr:alpha/beta hydrolase [Desulfosporosinus sp. SRJS8]MCB8817845.1 alpha/beta hydrolase [Desulfosporosinus sp. SRJS8]